ncbi:hypothetical protein HB991_15615 [Yersinia mollaretii]|uniref:Bacteriophage protein n=1 Tax=Yersinia mollaretii TaxID=33060 RepID=A0AA44CNB0_YERMO|nr:hypothetical protein [Yersinia mollaretii]NIL23929.1 hypothetical protein [Yersinia mollaretii]CNI94402.1 putative bacteriophage protein [Yersinia mollaretii]CNK32769.1 putative bacteriophage protein [Yersinia enterocolitica]CQQ13292.1 putative bacteriophage protein [Yersinia mollaretii]
MNEQSQLPYWWSGTLALFSALSLQDYIFILGTIISIIFTIKTYYVNLREKDAIVKEEQRRTEILRNFLRNKSGADIPAAIAVCHDALHKIGR